ncbi:MAG: phage portal protein [Pseudomonadota bacterium]
MNLFERTIASLSPSLALERARNRLALEATARYDAATRTRRGASIRVSRDDADAASHRRDIISFAARDMIRNAPFAQRGLRVIRSNVVGDGIIPSLANVETEGVLRAWGRWVEHFDSTAIDARGLQNLYGLQGLVMNAVCSDGECLVIRRRGTRAMPLQLEVLEADYLNDWRDGRLPNGSIIHQGIERTPSGAIVAYHLYKEHPGTLRPWRQSSSFISERIPASDVAHVFRVDRPGQTRGVSWFAPVTMNLQDLADYQDAQLVRNKIAACFAMFRRRDEMDGEPRGEPFPNKVQPGAIYELPPGESVEVATPPRVDGYNEFTSVVLRAIAAGLGITYEALAGDLSGVNFSSARMGRMEMDRNISSWQWTLLIPQLCDRIARWALEAWAVSDMPSPPSRARIQWTPPARVIVDPNREFEALKDQVRSGFTSRSQVIRSLGYDPETVEAEIARDMAVNDEMGAVFDTDPRQDKGRQAAAFVPDQPPPPAVDD